MCIPLFLAAIGYINCGNMIHFNKRVAPIAVLNSSYLNTFILVTAYYVVYRLIILHIQMPTSNLQNN